MSNVSSGSGLPASIHRSPTTEYISERSLTALELAGLSRKLIELARYAQGLPQNGTPAVAGDFLTLSQLDRLDEPSVQAFLDTDEKAALTALHEQFQLPPETTVAVAPVPPLFTYERRVQQIAEISTATIAQLPADQQQAARRLQQVKNSDNNADTITSADLQDLAQYENVLPQAVYGALQRIAQTFQPAGQQNEIVATLHPRDLVQPILQQGVRLSLVVRQTAAVGQTAWRASLRRDFATRFLRFEVPEGARVVVKPYGKTRQRVPYAEDSFGPGVAEVPFSNGGQGVWIQVMNADNQRVANLRFAVPAMSFAPEPELAPELRGQEINRYRTSDGRDLTQEQLGQIVGARQLQWVSTPNPVEEE